MHPESRSVFWTPSSQPVRAERLSLPQRRSEVDTSKQVGKLAHFRAAEGDSNTPCVLNSKLTATPYSSLCICTLVVNEVYLLEMFRGMPPVAISLFRGKHGPVPVARDGPELLLPCVSLHFRLHLGDAFRDEVNNGRTGGEEIRVKHTEKEGGAGGGAAEGKGEEAEVLVPAGMGGKQARRGWE